MANSKAPHLVVSVSYTEYTNPARVVMNLRLKNLKNETVNLDVHGCVPRFWTEQMIPGKESRFTSITGTPLSEIRVSTPQEIMDVRGDYYPHYCADVSFNQLCRWIYGWTTVIDVDSQALQGSYKCTPKNISPSQENIDSFKLDVMWFDIETEDSLDTENTDGRVVSIALLRPDGAHEIGTTVPTSARQVKRFLQSQKALESVVEHTEPIPGVEGDVHVQNFDHVDPDTNEAALMWWFKQRIEEIDPDVIAGQNIKDYDNPYLINRCRNQNKAMARHYQQRPPEYHRYPNLGPVIRHRLHFDSKIAYAEQVQGAATTTGRASLSWMATKELGYGKVPRTRITDLMKDPLMLAVYNAWDNVVAERVCTKLDLVNFYMIKTGFHNSTLRYSHSNMMLVEDMMGHLLMEENVIMPSISVVKERTTGIIEEGGFVMDAPTGVWKNACELDNSMEYPSAIISGNFSPDTKVDVRDYPDGEYPFPITITPAGRVYRRDFEGVMPRVLRTLAELRRKTQAQMREAKAAGNLKLAHILNQKQRVAKENMNSWYGVLGSGVSDKTKSRPFRMVEPQIGSDITQIARLHNDWNKNWINEAHLTFTKEGIEPHNPDEGFTLNFEVLYQDTDSCKVSIQNHDEAEQTVRPFTEKDVVAIANQLCIELNSTYDDFVYKFLSIPKNEYFLVKPDAYYERYFSWGVKKRYAYQEFDGKQSFRGVEMRRSSAPQIVKTAQAQVFDAILNGCNKKELNNLLRQIHSDLMDEEKTPSIDFGTPMGIKKPGTQQYKAAMWSNRHLGLNFDIGDKPVIYHAKDTRAGLPSNRVVALEYSERPEDHGVSVDRKKSFEKHFTNSNSWIAILNAFNTSWGHALSGMTHDSFEEWFK